MKEKLGSGYCDYDKMNISVFICNGNIPEGLGKSRFLP